MIVMTRHTQQRQRFRHALAGSRCVTIPTVYDPLSARAAAAVGYELTFLAASVASNITLAAPDFIVLTLTEFAQEIRGIMRTADLSLLVDADHGYGNALNVMRTVKELEHAGVSALTIEDTAQPRRFGQGEPSFTDDMTRELVSTPEMLGKLKAAVAARADPSLVIVARTSALWVEDLNSTIARVQAYGQTGVDALFLVGLRSLDQLQAIHAAAKLPIIAPGGMPASFDPHELAAHGAKVKVQGHYPLAAAVRALRDTYGHLFNGGQAADLKPRPASEELMAKLKGGDTYDRWLRDYMS
jgi:carboxyvinyl-carboxyphosphonate phosphorylmutase